MMGHRRLEVPWHLPLPDWFDEYMVEPCEGVRWYRMPAGTQGLGTIGSRFFIRIWELLGLPDLDHPERGGWYPVMSELFEVFLDMVQEPEYRSAEFSLPSHLASWEGWLKTMSTYVDYGAEYVEYQMSYVDVEDCNELANAMQELFSMYVADHGLNMVMGYQSATAAAAALTYDVEETVLPPNEDDEGLNPEGEFVVGADDVAKALEASERALEGIPLFCGNFDPNCVGDALDAVPTGVPTFHSKALLVLETEKKPVLLGRYEVGGSVVLSYLGPVLMSSLLHSLSWSVWVQILQLVIATAFAAVMMSVPMIPVVHITRQGVG